MPTRKRGATSPDAEHSDPLTLSAEEAEAQAAEAEAVAEAARARANAIRLRREAGETRAEQVTSEADAPELGEVDEGVEFGQADSDGKAASDEVTEAVEFDDEAFDDEAGLDEPAPTRGRRARTILKYAGAAVCVLAIAALLSASAYIVVKHRDAAHQQQLNADFSAAARQGVVSLMSLDFNTAQEDVQRILDNSTGQFKEDFESQAKDFTSVAESSKVVTEAKVNATAVKTMTEDTADVLVSALSTITNEQGAKQDPRSWRLIVSMARDGDQIKMAKVEFAP